MNECGYLINIKNPKFRLAIEGVGDFGYDMDLFNPGNFRINDMDCLFRDANE